MPVYLTPPPGNPLTRALAAVVTVLFLVGAFMVGIVAFLVVLGVSLIAGLWLWFRNWRSLRQGATPRPDGTPRDTRPGAGEAIEGEYTVVSRDDRPPG
jgi:hypothetical protein